MHVTKIVMKDGTEYSGSIKEFRPELGWMTLFDILHQLYFKDVKSAVTEDERININEHGNQDEIKRARKCNRDNREHGWDGMNKNTPLQDWEK